MARSAPRPANQRLVARVGLPRGGRRAHRRKADLPEPLVRFQGPSQLLCGDRETRVGGRGLFPRSISGRAGPDTCLPSPPQPDLSLLPAAAPCLGWAGLVLAVGAGIGSSPWPLAPDTG